MQFRTIIEAPAEKVWSTLWNDATYRQWTAPFSEGSRAETDWRLGSKVRFLDASGSGLISTIQESRPSEFMSFRHYGIVKDGQEIVEGKEVEAWAGALENYTLSSAGGGTELVVDLEEGNMPADFIDYMSAVWPKAMDRLKEIAEKQ